MSLKELRKTQGIKQSYICFCLNIKNNTYSQYESGNRTPSIEMLPKLAKILNCTIEELVMAIIETKQNNSEKRAV